MPRAALAFLLVAHLVAPASHAFEPTTLNGECRHYWRGRGFSADAAETSRSTLYRIGSSESYPAFYDRIDRANCWKEWLVVVYMAADNTLSPYSFRDLWEMEAAGSYPSTDVVVFHDHASAPGIRYYHIAYNSRQVDYRADIKAFARLKGIEESEPKEQEERYLAENGPTLVASPVVKELPEGDSADRRHFEAFLDWAMSRYPSRRIMLVGWSHGYGLASNARDSEKASFALDKGNKNAMPVSTMTAALRDVLRRRRKAEPVDIAGSDACLNQQVEFGYEWRGVADYLFGSSTIVQNKGFNYRTLLGWFGDHPAFATHELAAQIPVLYGGSVSEGASRKYSSYYDPYATMATWTVSELAPLRQSLDALARQLRSWVMAPSTEVDRVSRSVELKSQIRKSLRLGGMSYDLLNLLQVLEVWGRDSMERASGAELKPWLNLRASLNAARDVLNLSVLAKYIGPSYRQGLVLTSQGVAIWLPQNEEEFRKLFPVFRVSAFYRGERPDSLSDWGELILTLFEKL